MGEKAIQFVSRPGATIISVVVHFDPTKNYHGDVLGVFSSRAKALEFIDVYRGYLSSVGEKTKAWHLPRYEYELDAYPDAVTRTHFPLTGEEEDKYR